MNGSGIFSRLDGLLRHFNSFLHALAGVTMVALMLWTVGDVISRAFFSAPFRGTVELTELAVVALVYLGLARAENEDSHIAVDLFFLRMSKTARRAVMVFAGIVSVAVIALLTWRLLVFAGQMDSGGYTTGVLRIPLYPIAMTGVVGSAAFMVAAVFNLADSVRAFVKER